MAFYREKATGKKVWLRQLEEDLILKLDGGEEGCIARATAWLRFDVDRKTFQVILPDEFACCFELLEN